ncbi:MAG: outer membrane protein assembly factor BamA [Planctomycetes bacterium]|nr:outer membrane protein assembly factor BamA [Planctomycetota bacterium]MCB9824895.1 outer membrane protein assembly factor BamA [Planctomycetota bacterium]MCB9830318.1 outer membrane protein assembly factor BamA [Planctomycetota bacterium]MCB9902164.1 outer membrane protein assembly factor BamA [Planctomycetota bacterium]
MTSRDRVLPNAGRRLGRVLACMGLVLAALGGVAALDTHESAAEDRRPQPVGVVPAPREVVDPGWVRLPDGTWIEQARVELAPTRRLPGAVVLTAAPDDEPLPPADEVLPPADAVLPPADLTAPVEAWAEGDEPGLAAAPDDDDLPPVIDYSDVPAAERPVIQRIELVGARLYNVDSIETRMRNKVGRRFDPVAMEADLAELRRFFAEIEVVREVVPGGIILRLLVAENPLVERLVIRGNADLDLEEIRPLLRTREGYPLSPIHLAADRDDIVAAYRTRGFRFADVPEPRITTLPSGGRQVDFIIVEGPKVEVSKVIFRGNRFLSRDDLMEVIQLQEPSLFERLASSIVFREDLLREDLVAIQEAYRDAGFLDAEAAVEDLRFSDDKSDVEITIAVDEGRAYTVGRIDVKIDRVPPGEIGAPLASDIAFFTEDRIRALFGVPCNQRWDGEKAREGLKAIREAYLERSFHDIEIKGPQRRGRLEGAVVDVSLEIVEGPKYRLARIDFVGNEFTRDKILRREVETAPGGYVDGTELERGQARLRRMGYFQRAEMRLADALGPDGRPLPGWKTATYQIVEGSTGQANFGFQVDPTGSAGLGAFINLRKRNFDIARWPTSLADLTSGRAFTGAGQTFDILIAPSTEETTFNVRFSEPRLFGSRLGFSAAAFRRLSFREAHDVDTYGYTLGLSYPLMRSRDGSQALVAEVGWQQKWVDLKDIGPLAVPGVFLFADQHELRSITGGLRFATIDDLKEPRFETTTSLSYEMTGGDLGGDVDFNRFRASHTQTHTLHIDADGGKHRFTVSGDFTVMDAFDDTPEVPPYERETLGGRNLRGFEYRGVGPRINGNPTGGEVAWRGSLEYEFPIAADSLAGVVFADFGAVEPTFDDLDFDDTRLGVGFGIRLKIPMLGERPLAIDFGWSVLSKDDDREQVLSFSFGRTF